MLAMEASDFQVAIVSALPLELSCMEAMLDETYSRTPIRQPDGNTYVCGKIEGHNVVLACLPAGEYGTVSAAQVATRLVQSFQSIKYGFMVGIAGGVPSPTHDIRLGDVVVGTPTATHPGVVQYDMGKSIQEDKFVRTGILDKPPEQLLTAVSTLQSKHIRTGSMLLNHVSMMLDKFPNMRLRYQHPDPADDFLYEANYDHKNGELDCGNCDTTRLIDRKPRSQLDPVIHYGTIASGNAVMRHGRSRDRIAAEIDALCFEMEAAGLKNLPCLVIRGICDYADSHKNKVWQPYAASVAAAYAKELLSVLPTISIPKETVYPNEEELRCLRSLKVTDPRDERKKILAAKDPLLEGSCNWVFENETFLNWLNIEKSSILWVHGDPGKGKTMIMMAAIDEIASRLTTSSDRCRIAYTFCQAGISGQNDALSIVKSLIYYLVTEEPRLMQHLSDRLKNQDETILFEGPTAIFSLSSVLRNMLEDPSCLSSVILIDALDECESGLDELLELICSAHSRTKWLLSSRNVDEVKERLNDHGSTSHTDLEVNDKNVSRSVSSFIQWKVTQLARKKRYSEDMISDIQQTLTERAQGTFLWVSLACKEIEKVPAIRAWTTLARLPRSLSALYERMLNHILEEDDQSFLECKISLLRVVFLSFRPRYIQEIGSACQLPNQWASNVEYVKDLVFSCSPFLVIKGEAIHLVHQSARDYLASKSTRTLFPKGIAFEHSQLLSWCLEQMSSKLKQNICGLSEPGTLREDISAETVDECLPLYLQYACSFWADHLMAIEGLMSFSESNQLTDQIYQFFQNHLLHWLEALSVQGLYAQAYLALVALDGYLSQENESQTLPIVQDALRMVADTGHIIDNAPLQLYSSVLIFSAEESIIRRTYLTNVPQGLTAIPRPDKTWSPCLYTIEMPKTSEIRFLEFAFDGSFIVSIEASVTTVSDLELKIWDAASGKLRFILRQEGRYSSATIQPSNPKVLAVVSEYDNIKLWNTRTGTLLLTLYHGLPGVIGCFFSPDGQHFTCRAGDLNMKQWSTCDWKLKEMIPCHQFEQGYKYLGSSDNENYIALEKNNEIVVLDANGQLLAAWKEKSRDVSRAIMFYLHISNDSIIMLWSHPNPLPLSFHVWSISTQSQRFEIDINRRSRCFSSLSPDGQYLLTAPSGGGIQLFSTRSSKLLHHHLNFSILYPPEAGTRSRWFPDSKKVLFSIGDFVLRILCAETGNILASFLGHSTYAVALVISHDGTKFASASSESEIKVWPTSFKNNVPEHNVRVNDNPYVKMSFSPNGEIIAFCADSVRILIWDVKLERIRYILSGINVFRLKFSNDSKYLAASFEEGGITIWNVQTGLKNCTLTGHAGACYDIVFTEDNKHLFATTTNPSILKWDLFNGTGEQLFPDCPTRYFNLAYSSARSLIASASKSDIGIWNSLACQRQALIDIYPEFVYQMAFSSDGTLLVAQGPFGTDFLVIDTESRTCVHKYGFPTMASQISFLANHSIWTATFESLIVDHPKKPQKVEGPIEYPIQQLSVYLIDTSTGWIYRFGKKWLWLPPAYRYRKIKASNNGTIALASSPDDICFIKCETVFDQDPRMVSSALLAEEQPLHLDPYHLPVWLPRSINRELYL